REQSLVERARRIADFERRIGDFEHMVAQRDADTRSLREEISMLRDEAAASSAAWHDHRTSLDAQIASAQSTLAERSARIQAVEQQAEQLQRLVSQRDGEVEGLRREIDALRSEQEAATKRWHAEKTKLDSEIATLTSAAIERSFRIESLEHQLAEVNPEAAKPSQDDIDPFVRAELASLRERSAATERQLREANSSLTGELKSARAGIATLNREAETAQAELARLAGEGASAQAEIARLNTEAEAARAEHARLNGEAEAARAEVAALHRAAETARQAEQSEIAVLREQVSDIAAQIAHLTAPERADNTDEALPSEATNGNGEAAPRHASLIERIRALQSRASRVSPAP
ncbi:MAG: hypothetical protein JO228_10650, partial [Xanthobacteraceae bacterium]|nr:hypothetical protein [Xanthobacteraceae bacterium]